MPRPPPHLQLSYKLGHIFASPLHWRLANHSLPMPRPFLPSLNNLGFASCFSASSTMETNLSEEYFPSSLSSSVESQSLLSSCHISCFLVNTIFPVLSFISAGSSNTSCRFSGIKHVTLLFDGPGVGVSTSRPLQLSARCYGPIATKSFAHIDHPTPTFSVSLL